MAQSRKKRNLRQRKQAEARSQAAQAKTGNGKPEGPKRQEVRPHRNPHTGEMGAQAHVVGSDSYADGEGPLATPEERDVHVNALEAIAADYPHALAAAFSGLQDDMDIVSASDYRPIGHQIEERDIRPDGTVPPVQLVTVEDILNATSQQEVISPAPGDTGFHVSEPTTDTSIPPVGPIDPSAVDPSAMGDPTDRGLDWDEDLEERDFYRHREEKPPRPLGRFAGLLTKVAGSGVGAYMALGTMGSVGQHLLGWEYASSSHTAMALFGGLAIGWQGGKRLASGHRGAIRKALGGVASNAHRSGPIRRTKGLVSRMRPNRSIPEKWGPVQTRSGWSDDQTRAWMSTGLPPHQAETWNGYFEQRDARTASMYGQTAYRDPSADFGPRAKQVRAFLDKSFPEESARACIGAYMTPQDLHELGKKKYGLFTDVRKGDHDGKDRRTAQIVSFALDSQRATPGPVPLMDLSRGFAFSYQSRYGAQSQSAQSQPTRGQADPSARSRPVPSRSGAR